MFNYLLSIWTFLLESAPLISAVAMIFITYYVYHLSKKDTNRDHYLRYIVDLYYRIEDDYKQLREYLEEDMCINGYKQKQCCRRLSVNCILMRDYVNRYPGFYEGRGRLVNTLYIMSTNPTILANYDKLAEEFKLFCLCVKSNKRDADTILLDHKKEVDD